MKIQLTQDEALDLFRNSDIQDSYLVIEGEKETHEIPLVSTTVTLSADGDNSAEFEREHSFRTRYR